MSATIGGHEAVARFPSSTAVSRIAATSASDGPAIWQLELALPTLPAGEHELLVSLDRIWHDEEEAHGSVAIDGAPTARVTILPMIRTIQRVRLLVGEDESGLVAGEGTRSSWLLRLVGSGFSRDVERNQVSVGSDPCIVRTATLTALTCELRSGDGDGDGDGEGDESDNVEQHREKFPFSTSSSSASTFSPPSTSTGPGLILQQRPLRADEPSCLHRLPETTSDVRRCTDPRPQGVSPINLRTRLLFPHHSHERHDEETGENLHSRSEGPVLLTSRATFVPPATGLYSLQAERADGTAASASGSSSGPIPCAMRLTSTPLPVGGRGATALAEEDEDEAAAVVNGLNGSTCSSGALLLQRGRRYAFDLAAILGGHEQLAVRATVTPAPATPAPATPAAVTNATSTMAPVTFGETEFRFASAPAEWFEQQTKGARWKHLVSVQTNGLSALCRAPRGCNLPSMEAEEEQGVGIRRKHLTTVQLSNPRVQAAASTVGKMISQPTSLHQPPHPANSGRKQQPLFPLLDHNAADAGDKRMRRLASVCGADSCCVVLYRGEQGTRCSPVPVWDFSSWTHPGGNQVTRASHRLCNSVRYSWLDRSGQHALQADPEDATLTTLSGGASKVGEFIDPACGVSSDGGDGALTRIEQRWSALRDQLSRGIESDLVVPRGAIWLLDANLTARSLAIRGTLRWDVSADGLELAVGSMLVERCVCCVPRTLVHPLGCTALPAAALHLIPSTPPILTQRSPIVTHLSRSGGTFELGTYDAPMLHRATIRILDLTTTSTTVGSSLHQPHPYLGSRFIALDGLAASALDESFLTEDSSQGMETILVTLSDDLEPGQTTEIVANG